MPLASKCHRNRNAIGIDWHHLLAPVAARRIKGTLSCRNRDNPLPCQLTVPITARRRRRNDRRTDQWKDHLTHRPADREVITRRTDKPVERQPPRRGHRSSNRRWLEMLRLGAISRFAISTVIDNRRLFLSSSSSSSSSYSSSPSSWRQSFSPLTFVSSHLFPF